MTGVTRILSDIDRGMPRPQTNSWRRSMKRIFGRWEARSGVWRTVAISSALLKICGPGDLKTNSTVG